ncbi:MAG: hypothetical protein RIR64_740 [Bacteroidota bacterium]|jgi:hypothetical protein
MNKKYLIIGFILLTSIFNEAFSQKWIVKDSILVFPQGFSSWLKRNNGGIDSAAPGNGNANGQIGNIGTNQGVDLYDFNKDGLPDLTFQLFPSNNATREYLKGIFIQNKNGQYVLDTNYVIKAKGDMWLGGYGDFNGDGLNDYHYLIQNYHGADSNRKLSPEMINDNWPDKVFINNGKSFDTLTLDANSLNVESTYVADIDKDGADEIIATDRGPNYVNVYKYDKINKKFFRINTDLSDTWGKRFDHWVSRYPLFNVANTNNQNEFATIIFDNSNSKDIGEPDWQPYNFKTFTYATYNFNTKKLETISLNRDSILIPVKYSKLDADDYYRLNIHEKITAYKMDIDKNGEEEIVVGGFYVNNYYKLNFNRTTYGWKVLGLNGKDLTTQFFKDSGIDRGTGLFSHGLDIDETAEGIEMIPGNWGLDPKNYVDGSPTLGYYYKVVNGKFEKTVIRDIKLESGKKLDSTYFKEMNLIKYPNFKKNTNALLMYDFNNIKRASIIYQVSCADAPKPIFDKTQYSICGTDSTTVKLTNYSKSDSTIWYVNNKVKATNTDQLVFKTNDTFYVTRIDTNGCTKTTDAIKLLKFSTPTTPTISRDTFNNLISSASIGNVWFKDGTAITDTTQKIKLSDPSKVGSYTVKTTQNGCVSALSSPYYFLVTDVINLSAGEFIKLAPNPFVNQLNFDFVVKGYQRLNIEVYDLATGTRVAIKQNLTAGMPITLGQLSAGTYIIKVSSNDNKIVQQFKMVKL